MSESITAQLAQQHTPAVKVGGRRLSSAAKPKHRPTSTHGVEAEEEDPLQTVRPPEHKFDDYPRPTGDEHEHEHERHHHEEPLKQDKKGTVHEKDLKSQQMMEATRPSKDHSSRVDHGRRINQPSKNMA